MRKILFEVTNNNPLLYSYCSHHHPQANQPANIPLLLHQVKTPLVNNQPVTPNNHHHHSPDHNPLTWRLGLCPVKGAICRRPHRDHSSPQGVIFRAEGQEIRMLWPIVSAICMCRYVIIFIYNLYSYIAHIIFKTTAASCVLCSCGKCVRKCSCGVLLGKSKLSKKWG